MSTATSAVRLRRIGPSSAGIMLTPEEFDALPEEAFDDRYRYQLIRGVLVVSPVAAAAERGPNDLLGSLLLIYQETQPQGSALDATLPEQTIPTATNRRRCDRAIWVGLGRIPDVEKDLPAIVVEFVSSSRRDFLRDYEDKRREYAEAGVVEYWIIDRFRRIMTVHRNTPGGPAVVVVRESENYQTDLLPGFVLPLSRLLAQADLWPPKRRRRPRAGGNP